MSEEEEKDPLAWVSKTLPFIVGGRYQVVHWDEDRSGLGVAQLEVTFPAEARLYDIQEQIAALIAYLYDDKKKVPRPACLVRHRKGTKAEATRLLKKGLTDAKIHWLGSDTLFVSTTILE